MQNDVFCFVFFVWLEFTHTSLVNISLTSEELKENQRKGIKLIAAVNCCLEAAIGKKALAAVGGGVLRVLEGSHHYSKEAA